MKKNCPVQAKFWEMQPRQLATTSEDGSFLPNSVLRQVWRATKEPKTALSLKQITETFLFFTVMQKKNDRLIYKKNWPSKFQFGQILRSEILCQFYVISEWKSLDFWNEYVDVSWFHMMHDEKFNKI